MPFHFSPRQLLRRQIKRLADKGLGCVVGLEIEWYLLKVADPHLTDEHTGIPGVRPRPVKTAPAEPGFSYHSESNMDLMQPVISALADAFEKIRLPLRSIENEWGPGQLECTFAARPALEAADHAMLFRTATRQICRHLGYFATFMCRPALKSYYSSGWHLHQSVVDAASGRNLFMPEQASDVLSPLGRNYLGGLMQHAAACTAFATPTVNGYRRYRPNSLAPDRATWCHDHRGVMVRVLGAPGDAATRLENRVGEPAANPYLYIASQIAAGLDGIEQQARSRRAGRRSLRRRPAAASREPAGRARCARARRAVSPGLRRGVHRLLSQDQAQRGRPLREMARRTTAARKATSRPNGSRTSISIFSE